LRIIGTTLQPRYNARRYCDQSVITLIGRWIPLKMVLLFNRLASY